MTKKLNVYNTKVSNHWGTPKDLHEKLDSEFNFNFDACPYNADFDSLKISWGNSTYCNPPYSHIESFARKARKQQKKGKTIVMLIPARTSTKYFHKWILPHAEIRFIEGRLKFIDLDDSSKQPTCAPFPSIVCVFGGE